MLHLHKKRSRRKGSKEDTSSRLALPKADKNMSEPGTETEEAVRRILADCRSERETGAKYRRAPKKNPDGTLNLRGSRPSSRASDRSPSGSPPIIIAEGNPIRPQSPKIGVTVGEL
jgi:hypothetical protein